MSESTGHRRQLSAGGWYAVLGDRVTLLLPGEERARVAGLWELVDDGADFDEVLDGVLSDGIRTLTGLVLVGHGDSTRVLVRGEASVTLSAADGDTTVSGSAEAMWADRTLGGVTGGTVVLEEAGPAYDLALTSGVTRVGSLPLRRRAVGATVLERRPDARRRPRTRSPTPAPTPRTTGLRTTPGRGRGRPPPRPSDEPVADVVPIEAAATSSEPDRAAEPPDVRCPHRRRPHAHRRAAPRGRRRRGP